MAGLMEFWKEASWGLEKGPDPESMTERCLEEVLATRRGGMMDSERD